MSPVQLSEHPLSEFRPSIVNKSLSSSGVSFAQEQDDADEGVVPDEMEITSKGLKPVSSDSVPMI